MHYFYKSNWYQSQHANNLNKIETKGLGEKQHQRMQSLPKEKPTEDADLPGPRCATMAPETALIQLCISSGLSA